MRARPSLSGDKLVEDYLTRVAVAARILPKGARMTFVSRTKAQVERQVAGMEMADPGQVAEALAALGEPEELVRAERMRIDSKWLKSRKGDGHALASAGTAPSSPRVYRSLRSRWNPAAPDARPFPRLPVRPGSASNGTPKPAANGTPKPAANGTPKPAVDPAAPAPWPGDLAAMMPPGPPGDDDVTGHVQKPTPLDGAWQLARGHLVESVAVVLIGLGGAILPWPFWPAGVRVALFSRLWDGRDKVAAIGGPVLVVLLGSVVSALFIGGKDNVVAIYMHALHVDTSLWIRLGCVLTAVYLGWRVSKGRRVKIPPWKR
jgi:hypothetical protein